MRELARVERRLNGSDDSFLKRLGPLRPNPFAQLVKPQESIPAMVGDPGVRPLILAVILREIPFLIDVAVSRRGPSLAPAEQEELLVAHT